MSSDERRTLFAKLGLDAVEIETREAERDVEIRSGSSSFHLRVLPVEDFPPLPSSDADPIKIPATALADSIDLVARAASRSLVSTPSIRVAE